MKCFFKVIFCSVFLFLLSCKKEVETPKVKYENPSKVVIAPIDDNTNKIEVADLPIQMEGTNYLLFPIGELSVSDKNYDSSSGRNQLNYKISNYSEYQITGYIRNLKIQQIGKDTITSLTDKDILIQSITYLKSIAAKTKQQVLVYVLEDMDTNKDLKLDDNDIKSLYLSDISGDRFSKISVDFQELIDWNVVESTNRLYFRTIEDTDKNGEFDKKDKLHYYFIDLSNKEWKSSEFTPI
jgi:hypothetical protein